MGTTSINKGYLVPTLNGDALTWGSQVNSSIGFLDANVAGVAPVSTTGGSINALTALYNSIPLYEYMAISLTGALAGTLTYTLPGASGASTYGGYAFIRNATTGAYTVTVNTSAAGSVGVVIPQGTTCLVCSDGTNVYLVGNSQYGLPTLNAGGSADVLTGTFSPSAVLSDGLVVEVIASYANATTAPTFQGITITKWGGQALVPGDIYGSGHRLLLCCVGSGTRWELTNPATNMPYTVNTGANSLVQLDSLVRLPALDASLLTNVTGSNTLTWTSISASQALVAKNGYLCTSASSLQLPTPSICAVGDTIEVIGVGQGGFLLAPASGQTINFGNTSVSYGYGFSGNQYATIRIVCTVANSTWEVESSVGTITSVLYLLDPFWNNVTFFMPLSTSAIPSTEASNSGLTITNTGAVSGSSSQPLFGTGYSASFNGSSQYLSYGAATPPFMFTSNVTIEGWFYQNNRTAQQALFDTRASTSSTTGVMLYTAATTGNLVLWLNNGALITTSTPIPASQWNHIAVTCNGLSGVTGTWTIWLNGTAIGTGSSTVLASDGWFYLGSIHGGGNYYSGFATYVRITNGVARYAAKFTPPQSAFVAQFDSYADPLWNNVLCRPIPNATPSLSYDTSGNGCALTVSGASTTSVSKQDAYAFNASISNNYVQYASANENIYGDFTIEMWINPLTLGAPQVDCNFFNTSTSIFTGTYSALLMFPSLGGYVAAVGGTAFSTTTSLTAGNWYHFALVYQGGTATLYVNGVSTGSSSQAPGAVATGGNLFIAGYGSGSGIPGSYSGIRVSNCARYTTKFTPPVSPFAGQVSLIYDGLWQTVSFMPRAAASNTGSDLSGNGLALTLNGVTTSLSSTQDTYSWVFNGTSYISVASPASSCIFPADFSIEMWVNLSNTTGTQVLIDTSASAGSASGFVFAIVSGVPTFSSGGSVIAAGPAITAGAWKHITVTRHGTALMIFSSGVMGTMATSFQTSMTDTNLFIGRAATSSTNFLTGNIAGMRVTKASRYSANYTPPMNVFLTNGAN